MTREKERQQAAKDYCHNLIGEATFGQFVAHMAGSKWADSHPQHIEIPVELSDEIFIEEAIKEDWKRNAEVKWKQMEMYYFNKFLNKACEWLYDHLYTRRDEQSSANHFVCSKQEMLTQTEFIEQFRKAMKGE